jgi:trk system potassium uptake protein TrkH
MGIIFMLIGGSSGSTAGGIKTVTVWVLFLSLWTGLKGREKITFRGRTLPARRAVSAVSLFLMVLVLLLLGSMTISVWEGVPYLAAAFETASAIGTVGLTTGLTPSLSAASRWVLILLMYTGRVGVLGMSLAFLNRPKDNLSIQYPTFSVLIG